MTPDTLQNYIKSPQNIGYKIQDRQRTDNRRLNLPPKINKVYNSVTFLPYIEVVIEYERFFISIRLHLFF